jgi:hypothetical protein
LRFFHSSPVSNIPSGDETHDASWFELKDNFESASAECAPEQLVSVVVRFVSTHLKIGKETFYRLVKINSVRAEFIAFKIVSSPLG